MSKSGNFGKGGVGNTKTPPQIKKITEKRVVPGKYWCFTWNNWKPENLEELETKFKSLNAKWIIGEEVGTTCGTPHLQGYVEFSNNVRPTETFNFTTCIHWTKRAPKATSMNNIKYCSKEGRTHCGGGFKPFRSLVDPMEGLTLRKWQLMALDIIATPCLESDRRIHWFWEEEGNAGKSTFAKHLCMLGNTYYCYGKGADIKFALLKYMECNQCDLVIVDVPRSKSKEPFHYDAVEEIKNGIFFSGKFESGMTIYNKFHVFVFANFRPEKEEMSGDRWRIYHLK